MLLAERVGFEPTERFPVHSISSAANSTTLAPLRKQLSNCGLRIAELRRLLDFVQSAICNLQSAMLLAERVGFEPTVGVNPLRFSRPVH